MSLKKWVYIKANVISHSGVSTGLFTFDELSFVKEQSGSTGLPKKKHHKLYQQVCAKAFKRWKNRNK